MRDSFHRVPHAMGQRLFSFFSGYAGSLVLDSNKEGLFGSATTTRTLRRGRRNSSPPQFGQTAFIASVQGGQNVHS
jgi:hypothetical protein